MMKLLIITLREDATMSKKLIWLSALVFAFVLGQPGFACDKSNPHCSMHQRFDKLAQELQLTPEQKAKMKTYKEQARASMKANHAQLKALRGQINTLVKSDKIDEAKLNGLVEQVNKIRGNMLKNRIMMQHELYSILTDKQKAKYQELKQGWEKKHQ